MKDQTTSLAHAASRLTVEDFDWLRRQSVVGDPAIPHDGSAGKCVTVTRRGAASRRGAAAQAVETASQPEHHSQAPEAASGSPETASPRELHSQEPGSEPRSEKKRRSRRARPHQWPPVGAILSADYRGTRYEAEVIEAPRYKSGRALKILTGPAAGKVFPSMSGAMLAATAAQRAEQSLGRRGVSCGWKFWKPEKGART